MQDKAPLAVVTVLAFAIITALPLSQSHGFTPGHHAAEFTNDTWINSRPLLMKHLRGKVVLVEFWTFGCYNCQNVEPYVKSWYGKYKDLGLVVIGVHSPEFGHERILKNVQTYVSEHRIEYPIAIDNDFKTWKSYQNRYWPAMYLIDKQGLIRYTRSARAAMIKPRKRFAICWRNSSTTSGEQLADAVMRKSRRNFWDRLRSRRDLERQKSRVLP